MRTGLVVVGAVLAILGAGLVVTLFFLSGGPSSSVQTSFQDPSLGSLHNQTWVIPGPPGAGSVIVTWTASPGADVYVTPATSCVAPTGYCPTGPPQLNWTLATSGKGSISTANAPDYLLEVLNPGDLELKFSAYVSVSYSPSPVIAAWIWGLIASGGIALLAIGGVALFLGLYLPGGVYQEPDPRVRAVRHPSLPPDEPELEPEDGPGPR